MLKRIQSSVDGSIVPFWHPLSDFLRIINWWCGNGGLLICKTLLDMMFDFKEGFH